LQVGCIYRQQTSERVGHPDGENPCSLCGKDSVGRILKDDGFLLLDLKRFQYGLEQGRRGLGEAHIVAAHQAVEFTNRAVNAAKEDRGLPTADWAVFDDGVRWPLMTVAVYQRQPFTQAGHSITMNENAYFPGSSRIPLSDKHEGNRVLTSAFVGEFRERADLRSRLMSTARRAG
jgi:hypothetical protein